jgi:hypothetical protein
MSFDPTVPVESTFDYGYLNATGLRAGDIVNNRYGARRASPATIHLPPLRAQNYITRASPAAVTGSAPQQNLGMQGDSKSGGGVISPGAKAPLVTTATPVSTGGIVQSIKNLFSGKNMGMLLIGGVLLLVLLVYIAGRRGKKRSGRGERRRRRRVAA